MSGRYARVYHDLMDDPKFEAVYPDDHRFALWVRLLMAADASYPSPSTIPRRVNRSALAHLVSVGLIDLVPGDRYKVHGLARERADGARIGREGGLERARTAPREQGRFVRETPANAGDAGPAHAGPAHQPHNATQHNATQRAGSSEPLTTKRNGIEEGAPVQSLTASIEAAVKKHAPTETTP